LFLLFVPSIVYKKKGVGKEQEGRGLLVGFSVPRQNMACYPNRKFMNHEAEDGDISFTEEARSGTDRVGMADDR
jgi:hypothetical protein